MNLKSIREWRGNGWLQLLIGSVAIWVLITIIVPGFSERVASPILKYNEGKDIDAGALFYSDSEEAVEANYYMIKD